MIAGTFAWLALALPSQSARNSGPDTAPASAEIHYQVVCEGVQSVPVTADAEQALPLRLIASLRCGDVVSKLSDSQGHTVQVRTPDGKNGYVARMYLSEAASNSANDRQPVQAVLDSSIARWRSGAPGSDQFVNGGFLVESLTANGITVQVSLHDTGWRLRANVAIANNSDKSVQFTPSRFTLDELTPRLRSLSFQNPNEPAKALTHRIHGTHASATAPASAVYRIAAYKTSQFAPSTPNYLVQRSQPIQGTALQARTLAPKANSSGLVWFQRDKNARELNLRIFVGDQIFEFPLSFAPRE